MKAMKAMKANWMCRMLTLSLLLNTLRMGAALKNDFVTLESLCPSSGSVSGLLSSGAPRAVDGVVLVASGERQLDCLLTFQTESILERFRLRFEELLLDCNDRLLLYDGAHAMGMVKANLSCEAMVESVGILQTRTNYLTLRYVVDQWTTLTNGFRLVLTAFKEKHNGQCRDGFDCEIEQGVCIDNDLVCDNVNHCGNAADERHSQFCSLKREGSLFSAIMSVGRICPCENDESEKETELKLPQWLNDDDPTSMAMSMAVVLLIVGLTLALLVMCYAKHLRRSATALPSTVTALTPRLPTGSDRGLPSRSVLTQLGKELENERALLNGAAVNAATDINLGFSLSGGPSSSSTSLMATGNTHHIFDSAPPIQDDPFAESSKALTALIDNSGNEKRPGCGTEVRRRCPCNTPTPIATDQ